MCVKIFLKSIVFCALHTLKKEGFMEEKKDFYATMLKTAFMMTGNPLIYIDLCERREELKNAHTKGEDSRSL